MNHSQASIDAAQRERKRQIALIHIAVHSVGWSKGQYRAHLMGQYGVDSCTGLSNAQRDELLAHFKGLGFKVKPQSAQAGQPGSTRKVIIGKPMVTKLRAMWYALAEVGAVKRPGTGLSCDAQIEAWAKQELPKLDALRFASTAQLTELTERMKAWGRRVGADIY